MIACESRPITATPVPSAKPAVSSGISIAKSEPKTRKSTTAAAMKPKAVPLMPGLLVCSIAWPPSWTWTPFLGGVLGDGDHPFDRADREFVRRFVEGDGRVGDPAVLGDLGRRAGRVRGGDGADVGELGDLFEHRRHPRLDARGR